MPAETTNGYKLPTSQDSNTRAFLRGNQQSRALGAFYTDYGTQLYVQDGSLFERKFVDNPPHLECTSSISSPSSSPEPCPSEEVCMEGQRRQDVRTALAALEFYNKKHKTDYKLVEPLVSIAHFDDVGMWYHCNFTAKPETLENGNGDSSTKFFFAELKIPEDGYGKRLDVITCRPIDGTKSTTACISCCGSKLVHPTRGFRYGRYEGKPRVLRLRKR